MKAYPLKSMNINQAKEKQFELIDIICKNLKGFQVLQLGDLGVQKENNMPIRTRQVEKILSQFFKSEDSILLRGAGTNAIRMALFSMLENENIILVHDAPIYKTTEVNLKAMKLKIIKYNFNKLNSLEKVIKKEQIKTVLLQHSRQKLDDKYDLEKVIKKIKEISEDIKILVDDNYAILKTSKNSIEMGADISAFSTFKLMGPEGIGLVIGKKNIIDNIRKYNYSGGSQVQGFEAMEVLRSLCFAPVQLAIQAEQLNELKKILDDKKRFSYIKNTVIANAQSKVLLVEFKEKIAKKIIENSNLFGALPNPVGAESKYDITPLIYRVSGTFSTNNKELLEKVIRINPNRASAKTIADIIEKAYHMKEGTD